MRQEIRRGLWSLGLIASLAPFFGFFGTVVGVMNSFRSVTGPKSAILAYTANAIAESLAPTLLGLLVAILAYCSHRYLDGQARNFDVEISCTTSDLINALRFHLHRLRVECPTVGMALSRPLSNERAGRESGLEPSPARLRFQLQRMWRHGVLELVWPKLRSRFDSEVVAQAAGGLCGGYAVLCLLSCWLHNKLFTGMALAAFFSFAGMGIAARRKQALLAVYAFLLVSAILRMIAFGPSFLLLCCVVAAVPLVGTWKTVGTILPRESRFRVVALPALTVCAIGAVAFGTVLYSYDTRSGDFSMAPTVRPGDRLIGIGRGLAGAVKRGELWEVNAGGHGVARVIGMPGDDIQIRVGKLVLNGVPVDEPYAGVYTDPTGDFPVPNETYDDLFFRGFHERAYGRNMTVNTVFRVPAEHYFVLNDNRKELGDSRIFGPLSRDQMLAKGFLIWKRSHPSPSQ